MGAGCNERLSKLRPIFKIFFGNEKENKEFECLLFYIEFDVSCVNQTENEGIV